MSAPTYQAADGTLVEAMQVPYKDPELVEQWSDGMAVWGNVTDGRVGRVFSDKPRQVEHIDVSDWVTVRGVRALVDEWLIRHADGSWTAMPDADFKAAYTATT